MQPNNLPSSSEEQSSSLLRFLKGTPGILIAAAAVIGSLGTIWGFLLEPFKKFDEWTISVAKKALETEIPASVSLEARISQISKKQIYEALRSRDEIERYRDISRAVAIDAMQSIQGSKVIESIAKSVIDKSAEERKNIEFAYGFSIRFDGSEIASRIFNRVYPKGRVYFPKNRVYFYATERHKVKLSLYFSGLKKFPVDIRIDGKPIKRNVQDIRENMDVTPKITTLDYKPTLISTQFAATQFTPPIDLEEERPKGVHYLELSPRVGYAFDTEDLYYISGVLIVTRQTK
jgi:hypothetical protein